MLPFGSTDVVFSSIGDDSISIVVVAGSGSGWKGDVVGSSWPSDSGRRGGDDGDSTQKKVEQSTFIY